MNPVILLTPKRIEDVILSGILSLVNLSGETAPQNAAAGRLQSFLATRFDTKREYSSGA